VTTFEMHGVGSRTEQHADQSGLSANGSFESGTWRVVFRHPRQSAGNGGRFASGAFVPVAFANWDGSNGEIGSKHTLTRWVWLWLAPRSGLEVVYVPAGVVLILGGVLASLSARARRILGDEGDSRDDAC
jgi:hypothetical protein